MSRYEGWRGVLAKSENTFSAFCLYFFNFLPFGFTGASLIGSDSTGTSLITPSPFPERSHEELSAPTDVADSLDFNEGDNGSVLPMEADGVSNPALDIPDCEIELG